MEEIEAAAEPRADGRSDERVEAAAELLRREVVALNELGSRYAELNRHVDVLAGERDAVANEYEKRYRDLAGGQFVIDALRQLGMKRQLTGQAKGNSGSRRAAARRPEPRSGPAAGEDATVGS